VPFKRKRAETAASDSGDFDPAKIDLVAVSPNRDSVNLYIVVDSAWTGSDAQIRSLLEKIHNYVGFAVDGQLAARYPDVAGLPWTIVIDSHVGPPDAATQHELSRLDEPIRNYGGSLRVRS
jgi:hypothetical protein